MKLEKREMRFNALKLTNTRTDTKDENLLLVEGYGCHFNEPNGNGEIVTENSFTDFFEQLKAGGQMPYFNYQHNATDIIGGWDSVEADERGLICKGHINKRVALVRDTVLPLIESGDLAGLSTEGYSMGWWDDEKNVWHAEKFMLLGISLVSLPADFQAQMVVRNELRMRELQKKNDWNVLMNL